MGNRIDGVEARKDFDFQKGERLRRCIVLLGITFCLIALGLTWVWRKNIFYYQYYEAILLKTEAPPAQITPPKNDEKTAGSGPGLN